MDNSLISEDCHSKKIEAKKIIDLIINHFYILMFSLE